ncbi:MAG: MurR/RpiR family transcriptional regulator [Alphaproteobacteria bacterium]|nr:MurR/RpiR family transcriptional regulator [Alphaproteobacteria bacterium]
MTAKTSQNSVPTTAPRSADELRSLLVAIKQGRSDINLGSKAADALGQILELGADQSLLTITTLAERLGINPSTLSRLARNLGYSGFTEFRSILLSENLSPAISFYTRQAQQALQGGDFGLDERISQLASENTKNIDYFTDSFDRGEFAETVDLLARSPRIRIFAVRQFLSMAMFLSYGLGMIRSDVSLLDAPGLGTAEGLAGMSSQDVLVVFSCSPYTKQVIEVCRAAHETGIETVVITDRASSPLVEFARHAIFVPHKTSFLSNSITTFAFCVESLINGTATVLGDAAKDALQRRDELIHALDIETY